MEANRATRLFRSAPLKSPALTIELRSQDGPILQTNQATRQTLFAHRLPAEPCRRSKLPHFKAA